MAVLALGLGAAGCGGSSGPRTVALSLLAPTNGATVNVRALVVFGRVDPPSAAVSVGGTRVRVVRGVFKRPVYLRGRAAHIAVSARARGYQGAHLVATVHYRAPPRTLASSGGRPRGIATSAGILGAAAFAGPSGAASSSTAQQFPPTGVGPNIRSPQGRELFMTACTQLPDSWRAACGCVYHKLATSPQLQTPAQQTAFITQTISAELHHDAAAVPAVGRTAILQCVAQAGLPGG